MNTGTRKSDSGGLWRKNRPEPTPARSTPARRPDRERLRLVGIDDPAASNDHAPDEEDFFARPPRRSFADYLADQRAIAQQPADPLEVAEIVEAAESLPPREPGVDLGMLQSQGLDTAKLASFMNAVPPVGKGGKPAVADASSKAIEMPLAKTDLQQILQTDNVCMVARPQGNAAAPVDVMEPKVEPIAESKVESLQVSLASSPGPSKPHFLDATQAYLVENWPKLPPNVQAAILHVIDVAISPDEE